MPLVFYFLHIYVNNTIYWSELRGNDGLQKVAEPVGSEQHEPQKQDVPEQFPNESAESSKSQVCNAGSSTLLFHIHSTVQKGIYMKLSCCSWSIGHLLMIIPWNSN